MSSYAPTETPIDLQPVGKDGQVIRAFGDEVLPDDPQLGAANEAAIEAALK